ncbi:MAG: hypothetical protein GY897_14410 [Alteromonas sp.]|nr:hypothetical protein [Alteromonas sp.]
MTKKYNQEMKIYNIVGDTKAQARTVFTLQYAPPAVRLQFRKLLNAISFSYIEILKRHQIKPEKTYKTHLLHNVK